MRFWLLLSIYIISHFTLTFSLKAQDFVRKPYIQNLGSNQATIKFRLNQVAPITFALSTNPKDFSASQTSEASALDHEFSLKNLLPNTTYYYQIKANTVLTDSTFFFKTAPETGSKAKFSFWCIGDMYPGAPQLAVFEGFKKFRKNRYTNLFLTVGDNVYKGGSDQIFQTDFFDVYQNGTLLQQTALFPSTGNHDYDGFNRLVDNQDMGYFKSFNLPANGQLGGVPSNSEAYYSYNYGNAHFIVLETYAIGMDNKRLFENNNQQLNWLKEDLAQNKSDWVIVYFHYPLYTKGSYDSDANSDLIQLRQTLAPIFDQYKVDMVISGHSHTLERSKPTTGHYGLSSTFDPSIHHPQSSSGQYNGTVNSCPYFFNQSEPSKSGVIYLTIGASGGTSRPSGFGTHPIMHFDNKMKNGSLFCEIEGNRLMAKIIDDAGEVLDQFSVIKSKNNTCSNCFSSQPNFGCGPSGKPKLLKNPLSDICLNETVELQASGDSTAMFRWYDASGMVVKGNKFVLKPTKPGKQTLAFSQIVNGFESDSTLTTLTVHDAPALENKLIAPSEIYPYVNQLFSINKNDSVKTYSWTLPVGWSGTSTSNSISIIPNNSGGTLKVFGTSKFGCMSNELSFSLTTSLALSAQDFRNQLIVFPNPISGNWATVEVPNDWIGKTGCWLNYQGQLLDVHTIAANRQQHVLPNDGVGEVIYQVLDGGKVLGNFKVRRE